ADENHGQSGTGVAEQRGYGGRFVRCDHFRILCVADFSEWKTHRSGSGVAAQCVFGSLLSRDRASLVPVCIKFNSHEQGGGNLVTIELPLGATAAYDAGNQLNNWNGGAVTVDGNGNITYDAMTGGSYGYDERNRMTTTNMSM